MKFTKTAVLLVLVLALALSVLGCANEKKDDTVARVLALKGPTGLGMLSMMENDENAEKKEYDFGVVSSPDEMKTEIISGAFDMAALPVNLASVLYKKTNGSFMVAAINTLGVLYVLENGNTISSVNDLKGKTIYCTGGGSTPEYVIRYVLEKNGIDPDKDVTLDFSFTDHAELAAFAAEGSCDIVMLPEPNVTSALTKGKNLRVALDLTEEWDKISDTKLLQGCIVVRTEFAKEHPAKVKEFLKDYEASIKYVNENKEPASLLAEKFGIIPKAALALSAIPRCNIAFVDGEEMKADMAEMLKVLFDANPASVGGSLPDDNFYYLGK